MHLCYHNSKPIIFEFITNLATKNLNEAKDLLLKEKQISFLKEVISYVQIYEQLRRSKTKELMIQIEESFKSIVC